MEMMRDVSKIVITIWYVNTCIVLISETSLYVSPYLLKLPRGHICSDMRLGGGRNRLY